MILKYMMVGNTFNGHCLWHCNVFRFLNRLQIIHLEWNTPHRGKITRIVQAPIHDYKYRCKTTSVDLKLEGYMQDYKQRRKTTSVDFNLQGLPIVNINGTRPVLLQYLSIGNNCCLDSLMQISFCASNRTNRFNIFATATTIFKKFK